MLLPDHVLGWRPSQIGRRLQTHRFKLLLRLSMLGDGILHDLTRVVR
jgi:hypothetical protein